MDSLGSDDPALRLLLTEELGRAMGEGIAGGIQLPKREIVPREVIVQAQEPERKRSHTVDWTDTTTSDALSIVDSKSAGTLKEATVRSTSSNYTIYLEADGIKKIHRSFSELQALSSYVEFIDAFEVDGTYVLRVGEMHWRSSFRFTLTPGESVPFQNIFALWEEYGASA